jgi:hypothetical protein
MQPKPISVSIDAIADAALQAARAASATRCDQCGAEIEGEPPGRGLYVWARGDEHRFEEPALCADCSVAIGVTANGVFRIEEEEG